MTDTIVSIVKSWPQGNSDVTPTQDILNWISERNSVFLPVLGHQVQFIDLAPVLGGRLQKVLAGRIDACVAQDFRQLFKVTIPLIVLLGEEVPEIVGVGLVGVYAGSLSRALDHGPDLVPGERIAVFVQKDGTLFDALGCDVVLQLAGQLIGDAYHAVLLLVVDADVLDLQRFHREKCQFGRSDTGVAERCYDQGDHYQTLRQGGGHELEVLIPIEITGIVPVRGLLDGDLLYLAVFETQIDEKGVYCGQHAVDGGVVVILDLG